MRTDSLEKKVNEKKYISQWTVNARQHFDDGDYEWLCNKIKQIPGEYHRILELGCGAGYSTLVFLLKDFTVLSVDSNEECIKSTEQLIEEHDYTVSRIGQSSDGDVFLWKVDMIHELEKIQEFVREEFPVDLIVLCNPGGHLSLNITKGEHWLLKTYGFSDDEIVNNLQEKKAGLLHKWAMIYAACLLAGFLDKPFLLVDRGLSREDVFRNLEQIVSDTGMRLINKCYKSINDAPEGGIRLGVTNDGGIANVWGVGLYFPR